MSMIALGGYDSCGQIALMGYGAPCDDRNVGHRRAILLPLQFFRIWARYVIHRFGDSITRQVNYVINDKTILSYVQQIIASRTLQHVARRHIILDTTKRHVHIFYGAMYDYNHTSQKVSFITYDHEVRYTYHKINTNYDISGILQEQFGITLSDNDIFLLLDDDNIS